MDQDYLKSTLDRLDNLHQRAHRLDGRGPGFASDMKDTADFVKTIATHKGNLDLSALREKAPEWLFRGGEYNCLSGVCQEIPCLDNYAPNCSGCCCIPPLYSRKKYEFHDFFEEVMPELHTGDIVLCAWPVEDGLVQEKWMMHSTWTHCGMIYRPSDCPQILKQVDEDYGAQSHPSRPLILQFLCDDPPRPEHPQACYIVDFEDYMKTYLDKFINTNWSKTANPPGLGHSHYSPFQVAVRFLTGVSRDAAFYKSVETAVNKYKTWQYMSEFSNSGIDFCQRCPCLAKAETTQFEESKMFCSEFVARMYQEMHLINSSLNPAEFTPPMFGTTRHVWLQSGAKLSKEHYLKGCNSRHERQIQGYKSRPGEFFPGPYGVNGSWGVDVSRPVNVLWPDNSGGSSPPPGSVPTGSRPSAGAGQDGGRSSAPAQDTGMSGQGATLGGLGAGTQPPAYGQAGGAAYGGTSYQYGDTAAPTGSVLQGGQPLYGQGGATQQYGGAYTATTAGGTAAGGGLQYTGGYSGLGGGTAGLGGVGGLGGGGYTTGVGGTLGGTSGLGGGTTQYAGGAGYSQFSGATYGRERPVWAAPRQDDMEGYVALN